jgi:hypothetical protein
MSGPADLADSEETPAGRQTLIAGVAALTLRERLECKANAPMEPRAAQKRCDLGLFDLNARAQTDLIDALRRLDRQDLNPSKGD